MIFSKRKIVKSYFPGNEIFFITVVKKHNWWAFKYALIMSKRKWNNNWKNIQQKISQFKRAVKKPAISYQHSAQIIF